MKNFSDVIWTIGGIIVLLLIEWGCLGLAQTESTILQWGFIGVVYVVIRLGIVIHDKMKSK